MWPALLRSQTPYVRKGSEVGFLRLWMFVRKLSLG